MRIFVLGKLKMSGEETVVGFIGILTWNLPGRVICCLGVDPGLKEANF
jgi:hypothetical protein